MLKDLNIEEASFVEEGHTNFDVLEETLKLFDGRVSEYLRGPVKL